MATPPLPSKYVCEENPLPEFPADEVAKMRWEQASKMGSKWQPDKVVKRRCANPNCVNPRHCYPCWNLPGTDKTLIEKQSVYRIRRNQALALMATLNDLEKKSILEMSDDEAGEYILKLRQDRRAMSTSNKAARKVGVKKVSKRTRMQGQSLDAQLEDMSVEELEALMAQIAAKKG